jgi:hypothetical protein
VRRQGLDDKETPEPGRMNPVIKAQWVKDLRSGEFPQGCGYLKSGGKYCCLGVLCAQAVKAEVIEESPSDDITYFGDADRLPGPEVVAWAGLNDNNPTIALDSRFFGLAELNDGDGEDSYCCSQHAGRRRMPLSFEKIADLIEDQL